MEAQSLLFAVRYVSIGDIARVGSHAPNVAAVYSKVDRLFARPVGYDLVRNVWLTAIRWPPLLALPCKRHKKLTWLIVICW